MRYFVITGIGYSNKFTLSLSTELESEEFPTLKSVKELLKKKASELWPERFSEEKEPEKIEAFMNAICEMTEEDYKKFISEK